MEITRGIMEQAVIKQVQDVLENMKKMRIEGAILTNQAAINWIERAVDALTNPEEEEKGIPWRMARAVSCLQRAMTEVSDTKRELIEAATIENLKVTQVEDKEE